MRENANSNSRNSEGGEGGGGSLKRRRKRRRRKRRRRTEFDTILPKFPPASLSEVAIVLLAMERTLKPKQNIESIARRNN